MSRVVPAIIPRDHTHLFETLARIGGFTRDVQIDIVDGRFVPFTSWPYHEGDDRSQLATLTGGYEIELDLMIDRPEHTLDAWVRLGVQRIVIHIESTKELSYIFDHHSAHSYQLGLSLNNDTDLSILDSYIDRVDFIQLMGIRDIGSQGQSFDERVLTRAKTLLCTYGDMPLSVDGSVNLNTIDALKTAGFSRFISGSAILGAPNPQQSYEALLARVT